MAAGVPLVQISAPMNAGSGPHRAETDALFELHSGFWLNLHHHLYQESLRDRPAGRARALRLPAPARTEPLTSDEQVDWHGVVEYYSRTFGDRDLLFDSTLVQIKQALAAAGTESRLPTSGVSPELRGVLEKAAPIYRTRWWSAHDLANRRWIESTARLVQRHGRPIADRLAAAFASEWPPAPIRVDVTYVADWAGAYTTLNPAHITISSPDPANQGHAALEIIFHEASHALVEPVREAIGREARARGIDPRDLWHAVLFYTAGEIVRPALAESGVAAYTPYAEKYGLYDRAWKDMRGPIERRWRPYLDGKIDLEQAVAGLVEELE